MNTQKYIPLFCRFNINMYRIKECTLILFMLIGSLSSCKKLVDIDPPVTSTTAEGVFNNNITAIGVMTSVYTNFSSGSLNTTGTGFNSIIKRAGLSSDELKLWSGASDNDIAYYRNNLTSTLQTASGVNTSAGHELWATIYPFIITCNSVIEGTNSSEALTPAVKIQLQGEALFTRAFLNFYLVNLYGEVPLVMTTDFEKNRLLEKSSRETIYNQIIQDLRDADELLSPNYLDGTLLTQTVERVRPTKWAAKSLLARAYLYSSDWANAEALSTSVITQAGFYDTVSVNNVFLRNSKESIWQLQPVNVNGSSFWNTEEARFFVLSSVPAGLNSTHTTYLSPQLESAFDLNDKRKVNWVGTYTDASGTYLFPNKYKVATAGTSVSEYSTVLRLGEQYLIRAEARAQQNKLPAALADLNLIRTRAGLLGLNLNDKGALLNAIMHERQVELFTEWGHRWLDLKRTGSVDAVMKVITPLKGNGTAWQSYQQLYPFPFTDLQRNPNLEQNTGYN